MTHCPDCQGNGLRHTLLADGLPAHSSGSCNGILLSLVAYRAWRDRHASPDRTPAAIDKAVTLDEALGEDWDYVDDVRNWLDEHPSQDRPLSALWRGER